MYYIVKNKEVIPCSFSEWTEWVEKSGNLILGEKNKDHERWIKETFLQEDVRISTVFVGIYPVLFETMIFGLYNDDYQTRCSTYEEALKMHEQAVRMAQSML